MMTSDQVSSNLGAEVAMNAGPSAALPHFQRILLATDFSSYSDACAPYARTLAELYSAETYVLHVVSQSGASEAEKQSLRKEAQKQLKQFVWANRLPGRRAVRFGNIVDEIAHAIHEQQIDLVVLGTHGRGFLGSWLLGSVSQSLLQTTAVAVLTVGPRVRRFDALPRLSPILCVADSSSASEQAMPYVLSLAKTADADLYLLHAQEDPAEADRCSGEHQVLSSFIPAAAREWCRYDTLAIPGAAANVILRTAEERRAGLIVMGVDSDRRNYEILAHAPCPVLTIRRAVE